jgi:autotransporter passenger strand-loop-strand repeat protein
VTGDFNGDGKLDVIAGNIFTNQVSLYLGNGNGTFQSSAKSFAAGVAPGAMATGDFNGDGKLDLVVGPESGSDVLSILLGNGDGTFQPQTYYIGLQGAPTSIAAVDINGDGKLDLVVTTRSNDTVSVLLGNGDGSFRAPIIYHTGFNPGSIAIADVNGDGRPDVVISDAASHNISVLLNGASTSVSPTYTLNRPTPALTIVDPAVTLGTDGNPYINAAHLNGGNTTLAGTAIAGESVTVTDAAGNAAGTATAGADGYWAVNVSGLQDGTTYRYVATATDAAGNSSFGPAFTFTVDATAPTLLITDVEPGSANGTFTLYGTIDAADAGQAVLVKDGTNTLGTAVANADGSWSLSNVSLPSNDFGYGNVSAQATDAAGNTGVTPSINLRVVTAELVFNDSKASYIITAGPYGLGVEAGGTVTGARIGSGGNVVIFANGTAINTKLFGGAFEIDQGTSIGTLVQSGAIQHVKGGSASGATVAAGGYQDVINGTITDTVLDGSQQVLAGGTAVHTTINAGGQQDVSSGGTSSNTVINVSGLQYVGVGGSDSGATINGGTEDVAGTATGTSVNSGGVQQDYGTVSGAVIASGGVEHVYQGGVANGTDVAAGGYQDVSGGTVTDTVLDGAQQVLAGGVAVHTTIDAGAEVYVGAGGTTSNTVVNASGLQYVAAGGSDSGATIHGGLQYVAGTATGATVNGGEQDVGVGGTAVNTHLVNGSEHVLLGGLAQGIDFGGSSAATLVLDTPSGLTGSIANFGIGDGIDFRNTVVDSVGVDSANNLTITTSTGDSFSWALLAQYSASSFVLASDNAGGTMLSYEPAPTMLAASH